MSNTPVIGVLTISTSFPYFNKLVEILTVAVLSHRLGKMTHVI